MAMREDDVLLDAVLRPSPALSARAQGALIGVVAAVNLLFASYFVMRGAWPVSPFMGADVLLLALAFRASRIAARREEHITLTPALLRVTRRPAKGRLEFCFNPYWVRLVTEKPDEEALAEHASMLALWSHGRFLCIGVFLAPAERADFGRRLKAALGAARTARIGS